MKWTMAKANATCAATFATYHASQSLMRFSWVARIPWARK
jgi:hypothetical protein